MNKQLYPQQINSPQNFGQPPPVSSPQQNYQSVPPMGAPSELVGNMKPNMLPPSVGSHPPQQVFHPPGNVPPSNLTSPPVSKTVTNNENMPFSNQIPHSQTVQKAPQMQLYGNNAHLNQFNGPPQSQMQSPPPSNMPAERGNINSFPPTDQAQQFRKPQQISQPPNNQFLPPQPQHSQQMPLHPPQSGMHYPHPPLGQNQHHQSNQFQKPPQLPGQNHYDASHLSNQMHNMTLGNQKPNSFEPNPGINGSYNMPPPPLPGQQMYNGQQIGPYPSQPIMSPGQMVPGHVQKEGPMQMQGPPPYGGPVPPGGMGHYPQPAYQQQQQQQQSKRLDPDQMPSPIQVMQDDQKNRSGVFCTNQKGLVPPLVTTKFVVQDQGNASPRFIRSTMYNVPISQDLIKQTSVPFALIISPLANQEGQEFPLPIVNFGELGPVRCIRCKAYMCPFMQFIDGGRRFQCLFCKATTDVPTEYFQHLDHTGQRMDRYERPELILGSYEFVATKDYCRNNQPPQAPAIIFIIDVSYNSIKSGLVHLICSQMKNIIKNLPVDQGQEKSNMKVGFITYNKTVHFYNIGTSSATPQMMIVGDVNDMFVPLLNGFFSTLEESEAAIDALMQQIPKMFADTKETETILLPAITAGLEALKASERVGKLLVFHSSLPTAEAPGKLKNRDDRKVLGTDKEKSVLQPQSQAYNQLGQDCVMSGCSVDLFVFNNSYIDLATIGQVSRLTGGEIYKYTYFQSEIDGDRFIIDLIRNISRPIAFDCMMRVRSSTGVRPVEFYGHFFMSNTTDMELASIDCDKAVGVEIKHDDKLAEEEGVYIQVALLYTSCSGQRRLRILNLSLNTCSQMADLYRSCELDTLINYYSKQMCYKLLENSPKAVKDAIVSRSAQILATYRKNCASPSSAGQLILPECMKLLPLYVNCLLKSDAISGGSDMTVDDKSYQIYAVMTMDVPRSVTYFYPRLIPLHEIEITDNSEVEIPSPIRCSIEKMTDQGLYILENGIYMFLWIGLALDPELCQQIFGVPSAMQINIDKSHLPNLDNPLSVAVNSVINQVRNQRHKCMRLTLVRQKEKLEPVFKHFLVEDRGSDGSLSYVDFLCHMHKEIRSILS
ncbi:protein transport protein Sec24C isoform X2 [Agrilus planipennis]|uniref:Protein transport protein Sec24C isoform X2 n=1 Tax=Agrilus planipennis TaxID=224129 RepID=A0A1W4WZJ2_AGRPL|nr:protein transport protein Sec24C isoform X2 [Agrilus planipennis]